MELGALDVHGISRQAAGTELERSSLKERRVLSADRSNTR
jgi:hypothetical protein